LFQDILSAIHSTALFFRFFAFSGILDTNSVVALLASTTSSAHCFAIFFVSSFIIDGLVDTSLSKSTRFAVLLNHLFLNQFDRFDNPLLIPCIFTSFVT
jgi:hypothetical protein